MNKSRLFLFPIISFSIFSCSAMDLTVTPDTLNNLDIFLTHNDLKKPFNVTYKEAVNNFNKNTNELKQILENSQQQSSSSISENSATCRKKIIENLEEIKVGISKIVTTAHNNNDENSQSDKKFRINLIQGFIEDLNKESLYHDTIENHQVIVNKIANFPIDTSNNLKKTGSCVDPIILLANNTVLNIFNRNHEQKNKQLHQEELLRQKEQRKIVTQRLVQEQKEKQETENKIKSLQEEVAILKEIDTLTQDVAALEKTITQLEAEKAKQWAFSNLLKRTFSRLNPFHWFSRWL